jgi:PAS domain S-box-containing protein
MSEPLSFWPASWPDPALTLSVVACVLAAAAVLVGLAYRARASRYGFRELRRALDDMAAGHLEREVDVPANDPAAPLARSVEQLAASLRHRLAESEVRAEQRGALLDGLRDCVVLGTDGDFDLTHAGGAARELLGEDPEALRGRHLGALLTPESWEKLLPRLARRSLRDEGVRASVDLLLVDGGTRPALLTAGALPAGGLSVLLVPESAPDRAERRSEVEQSARYQALVEGMAEGALIAREGLLVYANPALARMLGRERDRLAGQPIKDLIGTRHLLLVLERIALAEQGAEVPATTFTLIDAEGGERPVDARFSRVELEGGPAAALSLRDLAPETSALARARRQEARLDATLEASSDALLVVDYPAEASERPRVVMANGRFLELFGLDAAEALDVSEDQLRRRVAVRFEDPEGFLAATGRLMQDREAIVVEELRALRPEPRWLERYSAPVRAPGGRSAGRVFSYRDITAQKDTESRLKEDAAALDRARRSLERANEALGRVNTDLESKGEALEKLNAELRRLDGLKSELLSNVSHELQTPLVSIKGYTEMILAGRLGEINEEQRHGLEVALRNIDRLIAMIDNLLSFSRLEREAGKLRPADFLLVDVVDEVVELQRETLAQRGIELTTRYLTDGLTVHADRDKIVQVLTNLVSNAIKFNHDGGRVDIVVHRGRRGFLVVDVKDSGVGIPEAERAKIFDRFFRGAGGAEAGSGIGLAIVQEILRRHGCVISVESEPGQGSTFTFTLPLAGVSGPFRGTGDGDLLDEPMGLGGLSTGEGSFPEAERPASSPTPGAPARSLFRLVPPRRD